MVPRLLSLVFLCLLGAKDLSAGVTQFPSHRVIKKEKAVSMRCDPMSGHEYLFWYQRAVGNEMKFLVSFLESSVQDESGMPRERFSAERTEGTSSVLQVHSAKLEDSGDYFCASAQVTVIQSPDLAVQKHPLPTLLPPPSRPEQQSFQVLLASRKSREEEAELTFEIQEYFKKIWMGISMVWGILGAPHTELNLCRSIFFLIY
uniref:Ig-like domain-containing protein n=1 Tax=Sus scrofa TaxID=9823 RepID=A0A8D0X5K0_PIG